MCAQMSICIILINSEQEELKRPIQREDHNTLDDYIKENQLADDMNA